MLYPELSDDESLLATWDELAPVPPESEKTMELRIKLNRLACRRRNLMPTVRRPAIDWMDAASQWIEFRESQSLLPTDIESLYIHEKGNPVATMSFGGGIWSYVDQDLPFLSDTVCLYDPLGINT